MQWLKVARAAILRHRLEAPIRAMWVDQVPPGTKKRARKLKMPFSMILDNLKKSGYIQIEDARVIIKEYNRLSNILHGYPE